MKKVLDVFEISEVKGRGLMLAGTFYQLDGLNLLEIKRLFGKEIICKVDNNEPFILSVVDVDISNSIIDKKNIFILVKPDKNLPSYTNNKKIEIYIDEM